jgi:hypothetical protein
METWRKVWREGVAPLLSTQALISLQLALCKDDQRLLQGATTTPPPLHCVLDWPVEAACLIGWCGWLGKDKVTVGEVEEFFANICFQADQRIGEPAAIRYLLNWFDDTPRQEMRSSLLAELALTLKDRHEQN